MLAKSRRISVQRDKTRHDAKLELWDTERDLCRITAPGLQAPPVRTVSTDQLRVGQPVYALGNPQGLESTLSSGLISSLRRDEHGRVFLIQTSAPISRGSSGGGLFDDQARLLGVTTLGSVSGDAQNLNFAVPADWIAELPARHAKLNGDATGANPMATALPQATVPAPRASPGVAQGGTGLWRRGDELEYLITDHQTGATRRVHLRVDRVEDGRIVFNGGSRREGADGQLLDLEGPASGDMDRLAPPGGWVTDDVIVRQRWTSRFERIDGSARVQYDLRGRFEGEERIETPAGAFQALIVTYEGWGQRSHPNTSGLISLRVKVRLWYAPALRRIVRFESNVQSSASGILTNLASRELAQLLAVTRER